MSDQSDERSKAFFAMYDQIVALEKRLAESQAEVLGLGQEIDEYRCRVELDAARIKRLEGEIGRVTTEKGDSE